MIDIVSSEDGQDIGLYDTQTERAKNILSTQIGSLEYQKNLGIDLAYFLSPDFKFQNESFKSYIVEVLAGNGINVASASETVNNLFSELQIKLTPDESSTALIAR